MLPEVIFFSETEDTLCQDTDFFIPDFPCFIVISHIQKDIISLDRVLQPQELPCPVDCLCLGNNLQRKDCKHLEKCTMTSCLTYILDISCTDTLLTGCHSSSRQDLCPVKYGFIGAIPELIDNKLLSLCGTSEKLLSAR